MFPGLSVNTAAAMPPYRGSPHTTAEPSDLTATHAERPHIAVSTSDLRSTPGASPGPSWKMPCRKTLSAKYPMEALMAPHTSAELSFLTATHAKPPHIAVTTPELRFAVVIKGQLPESSWPLPTLQFAKPCAGLQLS